MVLSLLFKDFDKLGNEAAAQKILTGPQQHGFSKE